MMSVIIQPVFNDRDPHSLAISDTNLKGVDETLLRSESRNVRGCERLLGMTARVVLMRLRVCKKGRH